MTKHYKYDLQCFYLSEIWQSLLLWPFYPNCLSQWLCCATVSKLTFFKNRINRIKCLLNVVCYLCVHLTVVNLDITVYIIRIEYSEL